MASAAQWFAGARPRTLPAAVSPVLIGVAAAYADTGTWSLPRAALALVVALALQVAVNYANDYSDGIRGTDSDRVGPVRLVGQGLAAPAQVKAAMIAAFVVASLAGLLLVAVSNTWWMAGVGALSIAAAWRYTGGDRPYGYRGLGEVYVFVFFGLVATLGTQVTQTGRVSIVGVWGAVGVGALSCAILVANNLRDIPTDEQSGKRTLAVRLGDVRTRLLYLRLLLVAVLMTLLLNTIAWPAGLAFAALALAWRPVGVIRSGATGRDLVPVLAATGQFQLAWAVLLSAGLVLSA